MKAYIFVVLLILGEMKSEKIKCPEDCLCRKNKTLREIRCVHKNLLNIGSDLPINVEILDISYNQITTNDDGFVSIKCK